MDGVLQTLRIQLEAAEAARCQEAEQQRRQQEAARMAKAERLREYRLLLNRGVPEYSVPAMQGGLPGL